MLADRPRWPAWAKDAQAEHELLAFLAALREIRGLLREAVGGGTATASLFVCSSDQLVWGLRDLFRAGLRGSDVIDW